MGFMKIILVCLVAYVLGSLTFATIVSKKMTGTDIRTLGNKNAGMSNMITSIGAKAGILTFVGDFLKGVCAVAAGYLIFGSKSLTIGAFAALFAMIGHIYPVLFGFRGGKGTAVMGGALLMLAPIMFLVIIVVFIVVLLTTKYIAISTIVSAVMYPVWMTVISKTDERWMVLALCLCVTLLSISKHIENIYKIKNGKEIKFSFDLFKKRKADEA